MANESGMTTPITGDPLGQKTITRSEKILSSGKGDHLPEIIKPANKESNQDRLDNAVGNESEMTTAKIWQSLDQMPIKGSQESADDNTAAIEPFDCAKNVEHRLERVGGGLYLFVKGEDISSLVRRVYGEYHPKLLDAGLKENQELKTNSITE